jgi:predicted nucleic acid-binding protein
MPKVIVNSTPLIALCGIGQLDILQNLYHEITIPNAVYHEIMAVEDTVCIQVKDAKGWIYVEQIKDNTEKKMYKAKLHDGEVEVMILAQEQKADTVTGTLGVLLKAKRLGMIEKVHPLLTKMKQNGFYIDSVVERMVLEQAEEK